jgi:hypothetical protein
MTIQEREIPRTSPGLGAASSGGGRRGAAKGIPTHEQIAARAQALLQAQGCPCGQDEQNWRQAEAELRGTIRGGR